MAGAVLSGTGTLPAQAAQTTDMRAQERCGQRTLAALQPLQEVGFIQLLQDWLRILVLQDGLQLPASPCLQVDPPMASESAYG